MNPASLNVYCDTSPAIRLLRSPNAPFVVAFLNRQFKETESISIPESELQAALVAFQEEVHETWPDRLNSPASTYLADWRESRLLRRAWQDGTKEPVYQLTPAAEQVIEFLDRHHEEQLEFVGTECRLRLVIETLERLVIGASADPRVHLDHLRAERDRIAQEIEQIENDGVVTPYRPTRIREQFATAVALLKQLQHDFRAVEEQFREITRLVQQRQIQGLDSRGGILGQALDAEDALRNDDQGVSFYEFFSFIQSPTQQERLRAIIQQIVRIPELAAQTEGVETVRRMKAVLLAEAGRVTQTERRLSATLRRLLDVRAQRERQRVAELLREIRGLAAGMASDPPVNEVSLSVDAGIAFSLPLSRTLWSEPPELEHVDLTQQTGDSDETWQAFADFARMQHLDLSTFRSTIHTATLGRGRLRLSELLDQYPPESGVLDVVGYLQVAAEDGHLIDATASEEVVVPSNNGHLRLAVTVPLVTFVANISPGSQP
ncbi:DUF3375 family protein [bacterium]|nr:DUF3375 family protein [bacterium]